MSQIHPSAVGYSAAEAPARTSACVSCLNGVSVSCHTRCNLRHCMKSELGPTLPTGAFQQIGSYLGYTGRRAAAVLDRLSATEDRRIVTGGAQGDRRWPVSKPDCAWQRRIPI